MNFDKISVPSVREEFVRAIENKILSGELKIGDAVRPANFRAATRAALEVAYRI